MDKKPLDRRPSEKPAEQGSRAHEPGQPAPSRKVPGMPEGDRGREQPEGRPIDKPLSTPEMRTGQRDPIESERSDRESGRPVQLEEDEQPEPTPGRAGEVPGGRQQEGREGQKPHEAGKTRR